MRRQATYDHLMTMEDMEDDGKEEAEAVLQRLNQTAEILFTVTISSAAFVCSSGVLPLSASTQLHPTLSNARRF